MPFLFIISSPVLLEYIPQKGRASSIQASLPKPQIIPFRPHYTLNKLRSKILVLVSPLITPKTVPLCNPPCNPLYEVLTMGTCAGAAGVSSENLWRFSLLSPCFLQLKTKVPAIEKWKGNPVLGLGLLVRRMLEIMMLIVFRYQEMRWII